MTDVVCAGCGSTQRAGAPFCAACGREFPRTGRPVVEQAQVPQGQVQQAAAAARHGSGSVPLVESRPPITTEVEVYTATQIPKAGTVPPPLVAPYAGVGKRVVAWLVDGVIAGVLIGIVAAVGLSFIDIPPALTVVTQEQAAEIAAQAVRVYLIAGLVGFCFQLSMWIWESRTGRTIGNSVMGLRTLSAEDRTPIGFVRELLRVLVLAAGSLVAGVGQIVVLLSPLWDKGGKVQGWQDKAARSVVVDVRAPQIALSTGLAPVGPGPRAPGRPAVRTAAPPAPAPGQYASAQMPPLSPVAPQAPAQPSVAAPDPWAFPQAPAQGAPAPTGDGLITGIPGSGAGAPSAQQQPAQQYQQPAPQQPVQQYQQPAPQQPAPQQPAPGQPESAWPARTWPAQQEQAAPPAQQAPATLPPQQHPESRPTRGVTLPQGGAAPAQPAPVAQPTLPPQSEGFSDSTRMQAPVLEPAAVVTVALELESGERRVIDGPALVGRNPQASGGAGYILVRVDDPTRSVSKNHAELGVDSAGLWLTDRGSTNGTVVSAPGRSPQVAEPGARVRVPVGSTIHVGDRRLVVHADESRA
ncbi:RDD family protein [Promicromonospora sp. NPDC050262]|uniref:RDD family protein n=1 Tax=Promicromonospora sp. NPDC050262 TaxID=3155036 RepID=UPI0033ED24D0